MRRSDQSNPPHQSLSQATLWKIGEGILGFVAAMIAVLALGMLWASWSQAATHEMAQDYDVVQEWHDDEVAEIIIVDEWTWYEVTSREGEVVLMACFPYDTTESDSSMRCLVVEQTEHVNSSFNRVAF
jgi:hypothetical protein